MRPEQRLEPVILLLTVLVIFFTLILVAVAKWMSSDGQSFQVLSGLVTGFAGALLMRVKPQAKDDGPHSTTSTASTPEATLTTETKSE